MSGEFRAYSSRNRLTSLVLSVLMVVTLIAPMFPSVTTYAAAYEYIICDGSPCVASVDEDTVTLSGSAFGTKFVGQLNAHYISFDWGDGTVEEIVITPTYDPVTLLNSNKDFSFDWSQSHTYTTGGSKTVTATLYHANPNGNESSPGSTFTTTIDVPIPNVDLVIVKTSNAVLTLLKATLLATHLLQATVVLIQLPMQL